MKKISLITLLFIAVTSFAQTKFIEVEVTDTISLKPINFQVSIYPDVESQFNFDDENESYDPMAAQEKAKNKLQQVKTMLESKKYKTGPVDASGPNLFDRKIKGDEGFAVNLNGLAEVKKLEELLKTTEGVETNVSVLKYADEQKAEELLIKKLIDKAKARATIIGSASGLKPGKIVEVKEGKPTDAMSNLTDFYAQILKMGAMGKSGGNYTGSMSKTFVVKFVAE